MEPLAGGITQRNRATHGQVRRGPPVTVLVAQTCCWAAAAPGDPTRWSLCAVTHRKGRKAALAGLVGLDSAGQQAHYHVGKGFWSGPEAQNLNICTDINLTFALLSQS